MVDDLGQAGVNVAKDDFVKGAFSWRGYTLPVGATVTDADGLAAIVRQLEFSDLLVEEAVVLLLQWANERAGRSLP